MTEYALVRWCLGRKRSLKQVCIFFSLLDFLCSYLCRTLCFLPCTSHTGSSGLRPCTFHRCNGWHRRPCHGTPVLLLRRGGGGRDRAPVNPSCRLRWPSRPRSHQSGQRLRDERCSRLSAADTRPCPPMTSCRNISGEETRAVVNQAALFIYLLIKTINLQEPILVNRLPPACPDAWHKDNKTSQTGQ